MSDYKDENVTRIMFHNIRHLPLYGAEGLETFVHTQASLQVDIQAFSEHCLDTTKFTVHQTAKDILYQTTTQQAILQLDSSEAPATNQYKPGGTGILALGNICSKLEPQGKGGDRMGRWSYLHLRRKHLPPMTIISIYQVCPRPTNAIGNTAFHQQQRTLNMRHRQLHPRKAFIEDLDRFLRDLLSANHDIILGGDFNEALNDRNSGVLHLATTHHLVDPFLSRFPNMYDFGTHINGRRRIDIALVTPNILNSLQSIGYAPYEYATSSDHRPLVIEFNTRLLMGTTSIERQQAISRGVRTNDAQSVQTYITFLYEELQKHNCIQILPALDNDELTPQEVEALDQDLGRCENAAEKKCRRRRPEYFSRSISRKRMEVSILKSHLQAMKMNKDRTQTLRQKMDRTGVFVELPITLLLTKQALKSAQVQLRQFSKDSMTVRHMEIDQKIDEASQNGDHRKVKMLKSIKKVEQGRKTYRILKAIRNSSGTDHRLDRVEIPASWPLPGQPVLSVAQLEDPKNCKEWRLVTEPRLKR